MCISQYECCGKNGSQDYIKNDDTDKLPSSCCLLGDCTDDNNIFSKGCEVMAVKFIDCQSDYLILTIVGLVALEVHFCLILLNKLNDLQNFIFFFGIFQALAIISSYYLAKCVEGRGQKTEQVVISE